MQEELLDQIIHVNSKEEFEQKVYALKKSGMNPREILKLYFEMDDTRIKLNISGISQIVKKIEGKPSNLNRDPDKALVFKYFSENIDPVQVVIKTGLPSRYVKDAFIEFTEMQDIETITFEQYDRLFCSAFRIKKSHDFNENCESLEQAVDSHIELQKHVFYCRGCGEEIPITGKVLEDAQTYLSEKWGHKDC